MNALTQWWQHLPLHLDPTLFSIGSFQLRWYSLGWISAFTVVYLLSRRRLSKEAAYASITKKQFDDFFFFEVLGVLFGARLGYVLFYNLGYYLEHPLEIILPFSTAGTFTFTGISGMSFHGGVVGGLLVFIWFTRKHKFRFLHFVELVTPAIPLGYICGRLGNFMNGELFGRVTTVSWGMYFFDPAQTAKVPFTELRHPSQLYEALLEGVLCGILLWTLKNRVRPGVIFSLYFISYGAVRFFIEFFRQPDPQFIEGDPSGAAFLFMTMGQLLCLGMILFGVVALWATGRPKQNP